MLTGVLAQSDVMGLCSHAGNDESLCRRHSQTGGPLHYTDSKVADAMTTAPLLTIGPSRLYYEAVRLLLTYQARWRDPGRKKHHFPGLQLHAWRHLLAGALRIITSGPMRRYAAPLLQLHTLPVVREEDGRLMGVISRLDIIRQIQARTA